MFYLQGAGVGAGIAIGPAYVIQHSVVGAAVRRVEEDQIDHEIERFERALLSTSKTLEKTRSEVPASAPKEIAAFLDAHIMMVNDAMLRDATVEMIRDNCFSAESALTMHRNELVEVFEEMEDEYLRSKKDDVDQVIQQIHRQLLLQDNFESPGIADNLDGTILVAHDLTPADTVQFMQMKMGAFVTNLGSPISHVAILANSLKIPAVVGLHGAVRHIAHGTTIAVDASTGSVIVDPDQETLDKLIARRAEHERRQDKLLAFKDQEPITLDGERITLLANVELPEDVEHALHCGAMGVGLYRTEYLFMNRLHLPTEEEQFQAYSYVVKSLKRVTIRTLDLGADKQVDGGRKQGKVAINPALGLRAVRLCLRSVGTFRSQLRAVYRASAFGEVQCMIPMLSNLDEIKQVLTIIDEVKRQLDSENVVYDPSVKVGGMIEVPAAAITADQFAQELDFLSIGTNDLIQYTLAIDRVDDEVNYLYDPLHSSILRLVKSVIDAGNKYNKPVSLCGEMASDGIYTRLLLGMGLRIFSMDPGAIPEIKQTIRVSDISNSTPHIEKIMDCSDSMIREGMLQSLNEQGAPAVSQI